MLECVVNVSEGRDEQLVATLGRSAGRCLLDVHRDPDHNRSVFTLAGPQAMVEEEARALAQAVVSRIDLRAHHGVHPRMGALDVVPFIALAQRPASHTVIEADRAQALDARNRFAAWAGRVLDLPCFLYGTDRTLPELRRLAWKELNPDAGPPQPHPRAGACAVGARGMLIAYNLWLDGRHLGGADLEVARRIAAELRGPGLRTLGLAVQGGAQVSCNLTQPERVGPAVAFDGVAARAAVARAELVGLIPRSVLEATPQHRWAELNIGPPVTIEARLEEAGLDGGRFPTNR